ncbi:MAG: gamma-glutamylcyclotransferase [Firmicutes bacterium]|nr:gamma-glutamylcyclotransferase [Bacillota bacterium]
MEVLADGFVFVYGTLMRGFGNYEKYLSKYVLAAGEAFINGELYHLRDGYPAAGPGPGIVKGELMLVRDLEAVLPVLDDLEDYAGPGRANLYERVRVEAVTFSGQRVTAWTYLYGCPDELPLIGVPVKGGCWRTFLADGGWQANPEQLPGL